MLYFALIQEKVFRTKVFQKKVLQMISLPGQVTVDKMENIRYDALVV